MAKATLRLIPIAHISMRANVVKRECAATSHFAISAARAKVFAPHFGSEKMIARQDLHIE